MIHGHSIWYMGTVSIWYMIHFDMVYDIPLYQMAYDRLHGSIHMAYDACTHYGPYATCTHVHIIVHMAHEHSMTIWTTLY